MLKIEGLAPCAGSAVEVDPWVPLKVSWHGNRDSQPFYLLVTGAPDGYVELKVHPESGALLSLTIIDLPVEVQHAKIEAPGDIVDSFVPVFDVAAWGDANQLSPGKRVVRSQSEMTYSKTPEGVVLGFSDEVPESRVRCGPVAIDMSGSGSLIRLVAATG